MQTKLISIRKYLGYTQKDMAKVLDCDERTYINKEHGDSQFKLNEMFIIAKEFNMKVGDIFLPPNFMIHEVDKSDFSKIS